VKDALLDAMRELLRETFEGGLPGQGTQYLDRDAGIFNTMHAMTPEAASREIPGHPTIASHVRHMIFHLRVSTDWMLGRREDLDWKASFLPPTVMPEEWTALEAELKRQWSRFVEAVEGLPEARVMEYGAGMGMIAHLAYHLGAIRQRMR
jgi:hypothetical protein